MKVMPMPATMPDLMRGVTSRHLLMLSAGILCCIGLIMVASASMVTGEAKFGSTFHFLSRHLFWLMVAFGSGVVTLHVFSVAWFQKNAFWLLGLAGLLLVLVLVPGIGHRVNGSTGWISLPGVTLQPSEIAKFAIVLYMASYLVRRQEVVRNSWRGFINPMLVVGIGVVLLLMEPDFGASVVMVSAAMAMLFLAGTPMLTFASIFSLVAAMAVMLVIFEPYRLKRLTSFMDPWAD